MNLWRAFTERQFQRAERQFHAQTKAEAPAAHDSGKDIHDHRQVDELFAQANVCDVDIVLVWLPKQCSELNAMDQLWVARTLLEIRYMSTK